MSEVFEVFDVLVGGVRCAYRRCSRYLSEVFEAPEVMHCLQLCLPEVFEAIEMPEAMHCATLLVLEVLEVLAGGVRNVRGVGGGCWRCSRCLLEVFGVLEVLEVLVGGVRGV